MVNRAKEVEVLYFRDHSHNGDWDNNIVKKQSIDRFRSRKPIVNPRYFDHTFESETNLRKSSEKSVKKNSIVWPVFATKSKFTSQILQKSESISSLIVHPSGIRQHGEKPQYVNFDIIPKHVRRNCVNKCKSDSTLTVKSFFKVRHLKKRKNMNYTSRKPPICRRQTMFFSDGCNCENNKCRTDVYGKILGPTPDEAVLAGLQTVIDLCSNKSRKRYNVSSPSPKYSPNNGPECVIVVKEDSTSSESSPSTDSTPDANVSGQLLPLENQQHISTCFCDISTQKDTSHCICDKNKSTSSPSESRPSRSKSRSSSNSRKTSQKEHLSDKIHSATNTDKICKNRKSGSLTILKSSDFDSFSSDYNVSFPENSSRSSSDTYTNMSTCDSQCSCQRMPRDTIKICFCNNREVQITKEKGVFEIDKRTIASKVSILLSSESKLSKEIQTDSISTNSTGTCVCPYGCHWTQTSSDNSTETQTCHCTLKCCLASSMNISPNPEKFSKYTQTFAEDLSRSPILLTDSCTNTASCFMTTTEEGTCASCKCCQVSQKREPRELKPCRDMKLTTDIIQIPPRNRSPKTKCIQTCLGFGSNLTVDVSVCTEPFPSSFTVSSINKAIQTVMQRSRSSSVNKSYSDRSRSCSSKRHKKKSVDYSMFPMDVVESTSCCNQKKFRIPTDFDLSWYEKSCRELCQYSTNTAFLRGGCCGGANNACWGHHCIRMCPTTSQPCCRSDLKICTFENCDMLKRAAVNIPSYHCYFEEHKNDSGDGSCCCHACQHQKSSSSSKNTPEDNCKFRVSSSDSVVVCNNNNNKKRRRRFSRIQSAYTYSGVKSVICDECRNAHQHASPATCFRNGKSYTKPKENCHDDTSSESRVREKTSYATVRITRFRRFSTYEVFGSTECTPSDPGGAIGGSDGAVESIFVLRNQGG